MRKEFDNKERSLTPDICKGIAIFLVVWGHVLQRGLFSATEVSENPLVKIIYTFHMPLFVLISGYFFYSSHKKKEIKELIVQRGKNLLQIILIWNTIHFFLTMLFGYLSDIKVESFPKSLWKSIAEGYWFLWAILFCTVAVGIVTKCLPKRFWLLGFFCFIPLALISPCRWVIISVYPFFILGFWYHKWMDEGKAISQILKYGSLLVYVFVMLFYFSIPAIGNSEWRYMLKMGISFLKGNMGLTEVMMQIGRVVLYYVLGITGSVTVIVLIDFIVHTVKKKMVLHFTANLGRFSLQIYILQRVLLELIMGRCYVMFVNMTGRNPIADNEGIFTWVYSFLISVICTYLFYFLARHVFDGKIGRFLFGR